jgi:hypothetical protein
MLKENSKQDDEKAKDAKNSSNLTVESLPAPETSAVHEIKVSVANESAPEQKAKEAGPKAKKKAVSKGSKKTAPKTSKKTAPKTHKKATTKAGKKSAPKAHKKVPKKAKKENGNMSILEAAAKVLAKAGKPLCINEIMERILAKKMWQGGGKTPRQTLSSAIQRSILNPPSPFCRAGRRLFKLKRI